MTRYLVVTGHDYRSPRKANLHFIAAELAKRGPTRMFSLGFSALSNLRGRDPRIGMETTVNAIAGHQGVECFLWRTWLHPFNPKVPALQAVSPAAFELYRASRPSVLRAWAHDADTILVESGLGVLFLEDLRRWNPAAKIIYVASDDLQTLQCDPYLTRRLGAALAVVDTVVLPSRRLAPSFAGYANLAYVPHGIDLDLDQTMGGSPYGEGRHAVSVGSMLFDPGFFAEAAEAFPDIGFHVIGAGVARSALPARVKVYGEMPFYETIPYLQHARFGIAPYQAARAPYYLADTSMKLMQYAYLGLPAVCPRFAVGDAERGRFGYTPGDRLSIRSAIEAALAAPHTRQGQFLSWDEVASRILDPKAYPDTRLAREAVG